MTHEQMFDPDRQAEARTEQDAFGAAAGALYARHGETVEAFRQRILKAAEGGDPVIVVTGLPTDAPRELVAPSDCDHYAGWCIDDDPESSGCSGCGQARDRATCGEDEDATAALDRLDITIRDHPMAGSARQWRLVAADLIAELAEAAPPRHLVAALARVRRQHDERTIIPKS